MGLVRPSGGWLLVWGSLLHLVGRPLAPGSALHLSPEIELPTQGAMLPTELCQALGPETVPLGLLSRAQGLPPLNNYPVSHISCFNTRKL